MFQFWPYNRFLCSQSLHDILRNKKEFHKLTKCPWVRNEYLPNAQRFIFNSWIARRKQLEGKPNQRAKQRRGKNNVSHVPVVSEEDPYDVMVPEPLRYIEYYQNNEPFYVVFTHDYSNAITCTGCTNEFPKRIQIAPYDIVLLHEERYRYLKKTITAMLKWS